MRNMIKAAVLALTGCVVTPADLQREQVPTNYASKQAPRAVANCMARNQVQSGGLAPAITEAPNGAIEVTFRDQNYAITHLFVVITATEAGSGVRVWNNVPYLRQTIEDKMMKGC
jgi:hypothetical protein